MPKIKFRYSWIYSANWEKWSGVYDFKTKNHYSDDDLILYTEKAEQEWIKFGEVVPKKLMEITGFMWNEREIICYIVNQCIAFSDPLTISPKKDIDMFVNILIHELIHRIFTQDDNRERMQKIIEKAKIKYHEEFRKTIVHVLLFAVFERLMKDLNQLQRIEADIKFNENNAEYKKSWDIVLSEGGDKIIDEFFRD